MKEYCKDMRNDFRIKPDQISAELFYMSRFPKPFDVKLTLFITSYLFANDIPQVEDTFSVKLELEEQTIMLVTLSSISEPPFWQ